MPSGKILISFSVLDSNQTLYVLVMFYSAVADVIAIIIIFFFLLQKIQKQKRRRSLGRLLRSKTHFILYDFADANIRHLVAN